MQTESWALKRVRMRVFFHSHAVSFPSASPEMTKLKQNKALHSFNPPQQLSTHIYRLALSLYYKIPLPLSLSIFLSFSLSLSLSLSPSIRGEVDLTCVSGHHVPLEVLLPVEPEVGLHAIHEDLVVHRLTRYPLPCRTRHCHHHYYRVLPPMLCSESTVVIYCDSTE